MRIGDLALKLGIHRVHAYRLAKAGIVPGTKRTKGGHFYFEKNAAFNRWLNYMRAGGAFYRKEMSRAYANHYGSHKVFNARKAEYYLKLYNSAGRKAKAQYSLKNIRKLTEWEYYRVFHETVQQLEMILIDWNKFAKEFNYPWPKEIKEAMRKRLVSLSEALQEYTSGPLPSK